MVIFVSKIDTDIIRKDHWMQSELKKKNIDESCKIIAIHNVK